MVSKKVKKTRKTREERRPDVIRLDSTASKVFVHSLLHPAAPNKALKAAADRYRKHAES